MWEEWRHTRKEGRRGYDWLAAKRSKQHEGLLKREEVSTCQIFQVPRAPAQLRPLGTATARCPASTSVGPAGQGYWRRIAEPG